MDLESLNKSPALYSVGFRYRDPTIAEEGNNLPHSVGEMSGIKKKLLWLGTIRLSGGYFRTLSMNVTKVSRICTVRLMKSPAGRCGMPSKSQEPLMGESKQTSAI